jgi:hypothetical protein
MGGLLMVGMLAIVREGLRGRQAPDSKHAECEETSQHSYAKPLRHDPPLLNRTVPRWYWSNAE